MRAGEDLARGHVALAVGVDPGAALDVQRDVGARGRLELQLARSLQALDELGLEGAQLAPCPHRVRLVEEQRPCDEGLEVGEAHARLLGAGLRRPQRRAPALAHRLVAQRLARAGRAGEPLGVDADERARVLRRLDAELRVGALGLGEGDLGEHVEMAVERMAMKRRRRAGQLDAQQRPGVAFEDRALDLEQQRLGERRRAHEDLLARLHLEAVAGEQVGEARRVDAHGRAAPASVAGAAGRGTMRASPRRARPAARPSRPPAAC